MTLCVADAAAADMLRLIVNQKLPQDLVLKLFVSDTTPGKSDSARTYTEASGFGYEAVTLTGPNWTIAEGTGSSPSHATYARQRFSFTGPLGKVYGYYLVQKGSGRLMYQERFPDGPYEIINNGDEVRVTPRLELEQK